MSAPRVVYYAAILRRGSAWRPGELHEQRLWPEHAAFMNNLAERGVILLGGPLVDGQQLLLILAVADEAAAEAALAADPWRAAGLLELVSVRQWTIQLEHEPSSVPL